MHAEQVLERAELLLSATEIDAALQRMARKISADLSDRNPVVVAVMNGGVFTAVNLCRHFDFAYEFDYVHATRYGQSTTGGSLEWRVRPQAKLSGRTVLLVDDVLDKGETLAALYEELAGIGAGDVYAAVLVTKRVADQGVRPRVHYCALETDDVYIFGCGMDYAGFWRGLPDLYAIDV